MQTSELAGLQSRDPESMKLTTETKAKIEDAWTYQAASSCSWAMSELNTFALVALHNGLVQVENYTVDITDLKTFLIWKSREVILSEIPILNCEPPIKLIRIVNSLVEDFAVSSIILRESDANNRYFSMKLSGQEGYFNLDIRRNKTAARLMKETTKISNLVFTYISEQKFKLSCRINTKSVASFSSQLEDIIFDFNQIEIR